MFFVFFPTAPPSLFFFSLDPPKKKSNAKKTKLTLRPERLHVDQVGSDRQRGDVGREADGAELEVFIYLFILIFVKGGEIFLFFFFFQE